MMFTMVASQNPALYIVRQTRMTRYKLRWRNPCCLNAPIGLVLANGMLTEFQMRCDVPVSEQGRAKSCAQYDMLYIGAWL